jgi:hypothetical protein
MEFVMHAIGLYTLMIFNAGMLFLNPEGEKQKYRIFSPYAWHAINRVEQNI